MTSVYENHISGKIYSAIMDGVRGGEFSQIALPKASTRFGFRRNLTRNRININKLFWLTNSFKPMQVEMFVSNLKNIFTIIVTNQKKK